mgnify:CR=1 FL=1
MKTFIKNLLISGICLFIAILILAWIYIDIISFISGRTEYHTLIPFMIGLGLSVLIGLWPIYKVKSIIKKSLLLSIIYTLCLVPIPFGPEGTLMPLGFVLAFIVIAPFDIFFLLVYHPQSYLIFPASFLISYAVILISRTIAISKLNNSSSTNSASPSCRP